MMSRLAALLALVVIGLSTPAFAQSPPSAAPTQRVESQAVAVPEGVIDATGGPKGTGIAIVDTFLPADIVVQAVMVLLLLASLWSWTIIFNKAITLSSLKRKAKKFEKVFWSGQSLDELYQQFANSNDHPMSALFISALREWRRAFESVPLRESQL